MLPSVLPPTPAGDRGRFEPKCAMPTDWRISGQFDRRTVQPEPGVVGWYVPERWILRRLDELCWAEPHSWRLRWLYGQLSHVGVERCQEQYHPAPVRSGGEQYRCLGPGQKQRTIAGHWRQQHSVAVRQYQHRAAPLHHACRTLRVARPVSARLLAETGGRVRSVTWCCGAVPHRQGRLACA